MSRIDDLIAQIAGLENDIQTEFDRKRDDFRFVTAEKRNHFSEDVTAIQRESRIGLFRYMSSATVLTVLTMPMIYAGWIPMMLLDGFIFVYQGVCFPVYGIPKVKRSDYLVFDRGDLPYLNAIERFNCLYCGYGNGLASYFREVSARTEQYWCPIKHARRIHAAHDRYPGFFEYGDADSYRLGLERLRGAMAQEPAGEE